MMPQRRSSRGAYKSLVELERRAKEAEAAAEGPLWGDGVFTEADDDDGSFDVDGHSDDGQDLVDSDFDEAEDARHEDEGVQAEKVVRVSERQAARKAKGGRYVDPALKAARRTSTGAVTLAKRAKPVMKTENARLPRSSPRRSTKVASERASQKRAKRKILDAERRRLRTLREAEKPEVRVWTQEELLAEAKLTEVQNKESLKELLRLEEEKKRLPPPKKKSNDPVVSIRSVNGRQTVSFTSNDTDACKFMFPHLTS